MFLLIYVPDSVSFVMFVCLSLYSLLPDLRWMKLFIECHDECSTGRSRPTLLIVTHSRFNTVLKTMPALRRQDRQGKEWTDDLIEWSGKSLPDLVWLAEDRSAYKRFVYRVAHARDSGTVPWLKLVVLIFSGFLLHQSWTQQGYNIVQSILCFLGPSIFSNLLQDNMVA